MIEFRRDRRRAPPVDPLREVVRAAYLEARFQSSSAARRLWITNPLVRSRLPRWVTCVADFRSPFVMEQDL